MLFRNPVYAGLIEVKAYKNDGKKTVTAMHEPIVSESDFWLAYYKMQDQVRPVILKVQDENLPLRGFLRCEHCEAPHTGAKCKGKLQYYHYYWCNKCRGKNFSAKKVDSDIETILNGLSLDKTKIEAIKALTEDELNIATKDRAIVLERAESQQEQLKKKIRGLEEKYFSGKVSDDTYTHWYEQYNTDLNKLIITIGNYSCDKNKVSELYSKYLDYAADLNYLYKKAAITDKHIYLKSLFPGCLTALEKGYRTPVVNKLISPNVPILEGLLEVKYKGESAFYNKFPLGVGNGNEIEHFLQTIKRILQAA